MSETRDTTKGRIEAHLVRLAIPLIMGNILQQFYNTIDAYVVGNYAGAEQMAAIGIAGTVMNLFLFAIVGGCTGFSVLFANCYGAGDAQALRRQHFTALVLGMGVTLALSVLGVALMQPLLVLIKTPNSLLAYTAHYLRWIFASLPAAFIYNLYASLLRSVGDTRAPLGILAVAVATGIGWVLVNVFWTVLLRKGKFLQGIKFPQ